MITEYFDVDDLAKRLGARYFDYTLLKNLRFHWLREYFKSDFPLTLSPDPMPHGVEFWYCNTQHIGVVLLTKDSEEVLLVFANDAGAVFIFEKDGI